GHSYEDNSSGCDHQSKNGRPRFISSCSWWGAGKGDDPQKGRMRAQSCHQFFGKKGLQHGKSKSTK
ncbi:unnamed protein product, partial [Amoebophrya sp. A120]